MSMQVGAVLIELSIDERPCLVLSVTSDETIMRGGSGHANTEEKDVFSGPSNEPVFGRLAAAISPAWLEQSVEHDDPDTKGASCVLTLRFVQEEADTVIRFKYGSESSGVPPEFRDFVDLAVNVTEPWYLDWRRRVAAQDRRAGRNGPLRRLGRLLKRSQRPDTSNGV